MALTPVVLVGAMAVLAGGQVLQSVRSEPQPAGTVRIPAPPSKDPYANLFTTQPDRDKPFAVQLTAQPLIRTDRQPRVVCGMVVVPVTPDADPKMLVRPKDAPKPDYKIRVIEPRVCGEVTAR
jgi:hypothetical protein